MIDPFALPFSVSTGHLSRVIEIRSASGLRYQLDEARRCLRFGGDELNSDSSDDGWQRYLMVTLPNEMNCHVVVGFPESAHASGKRTVTGVVSDIRDVGPGST